MGRWRGKKRKPADLHIVRDERSVSVLTPADGTVTVEFCYSLMSMLKRTWATPPENLTHLVCQSIGGSMLPFNRYQLAKSALEQNVTHTLWIDSDMKFPDDMLLRFLSRDEPIIGINALTRRPPHRFTAQVAPGKYLITSPESSGLEKVYRTGFGVMWVATEVFRQMKPPYFEFKWIEEMDCFLGEDFGFFDRARDAGYEFYIDHDLSKEIRHIGSFGYTPLHLAAIMKESSDVDKTD